MLQLNKIKHIALEATHHVHASKAMRDKWKEGISWARHPAQVALIIKEINKYGEDVNLHHIKCTDPLWVVAIHEG